MLDMIPIRQRQYGVEKLGRTIFHYQYRINKKGAECFRTGDKDEARAKLAELQSKRPGVYTLQYRCVTCNRYGVEEQPLEKAGWR